MLSQLMVEKELSSWLKTLNDESFYRPNIRELQAQPLTFDRLKLRTAAGPQSWVLHWRCEM